MYCIIKLSGICFSFIRQKKKFIFICIPVIEDDLFFLFPKVADVFCLKRNIPSSFILNPRKVESKRDKQEINRENYSMKKFNHHSISINLGAFPPHHHQRQEHPNPHHRHCQPADSARRQRKPERLLVHTHHKRNKAQHGGNHRKENRNNLSVPRFQVGA